MTNNIIGLESSSLMPLITITPITQDCFEILAKFSKNAAFVIHEDSLEELKSIFYFQSNTYYSNPVNRLRTIMEYAKFPQLSLKGTAMKLLLDGQAGGWIGNKNSRVQTFFFSDVIDNMSDQLEDPQLFYMELSFRMEKKIRKFIELLSPINNELLIDSKNILSYWGYHNISSDLIKSCYSFKISVIPNSENISQFNKLPSSIRRDTYHYHMLMMENVNMIIVGDAYFKKNACTCEKCNNLSCEIVTIDDKRRKELLGL